MARFCTVGELGVKTYTMDKLHIQRAITTWRPVYLNQWKDSANLEKLAGNMDNKTVRQYELMAVEYQDERLLKIDGKIYTIKNVSYRGDRVILTAESEVVNE